MSFMFGGAGSCMSGVHRRRKNRVLVCIFSKKNENSVYVELCMNIWWPPFGIVPFFLCGKM